MLNFADFLLEDMYVFSEKSKITSSEHSKRFCITDCVQLTHFINRFNSTLQPSVDLGAGEEFSGQRLTSPTIGLISKRAPSSKFLF
jgi:hypothetical protein